MADLEIVIANERRKVISATLFNLAAALLGAVAARMWVAGTVDLGSIAWILGVAALVFFAWKTLYLLQQEPGT